MRAVQIRCKDLRKKEYKSITLEFNNYYHFSNWFDKFSKHYKVLGMEWLDGGDSRDWTLENASWEDSSEVKYCECDMPLIRSGYLTTKNYCANCGKDLQ